MRILCNDQRVSWRSLNDFEREALEKERACWVRARDLALAGGRELWFRLKEARQAHVFLFEAPGPGDDITVEEVPRGIDEVRVRWLGHDGSLYEMGCAPET